MAIYPCDAHGARYQGPQRTIYPAFIDGADSDRRKMRMCPACFAEALTWIGNHLADLTEEERAPSCAVCEVGPAEVAVFTTVYDRGAERADYFGRVCKGDCLAAARVALFGAAAGS